MNREHLIMCHHCHRHNWHESIRCKWCNKKLPSKRYRQVQRFIDVIVIAAALICSGALLAIMITR